MDTYVQPAPQRSSRIKKILLALVFIIILVGLAASVYLVQQQQHLKSKATEATPSIDWVAKVNNEEIRQSEISQAAEMLANLEGKLASDPTVSKEALDYSINRRLLRQESDRQNLTAAAQIVADKRFSSLIPQTGNQTFVGQVTYKNYLLDQAIREALKANVSEWAIVDYLSIRYLWHNSPEEEELNFQTTAEDKINDYLSKIQAGTDIREVIQDRCQDASIDELPFDKHLKMYSITFDKTVCREQRINYKVGLDANQEWGEDWLKQVYQIPVGQMSGVIKYEKPALGIYFIVKVLDKGGSVASLDDLILKLRASNEIVIR